MKNSKEEFIESQVMMMTLAATLQRNRVYSDAANGAERNEVRRSIRENLNRVRGQYDRSGVSEEQHIINIEKISEEITQKHRETLLGGRFRIGTSQKALNLYLKYHWCLGIMKSIPPHFPVDAIMLKKIRGYENIKWTQLDKVGEYRNIIQQAKIEAGNLSLAEWELREYGASDINL